jgi:hypothetical protein
MSIAWIHIRCMYKLIHTKEEKKIWMDGDGYCGKDTRPHTLFRGKKKGDKIDDEDNDVVRTSVSKD